MHIELMSVAATQPNTGLAATALAGDSLTIKNSAAGKKVGIAALWTKNQTAGFGQIIFPSGHDTTRGYRSESPAALVTGAIPLGVMLDVTAQEVLAITIAGSNTAGDVEQMSMLMFYENLPGITSRGITAQEAERRIEKLVTVEASIVSTAGPSYGTSEALNADSDLLLADRDYCVMGCVTRTDVMTAYMVGPDTGNVRVGVPGISTKPELTGQWFMLMSRAHGLPLVPVLNSGNRNSTQLGVTTDENAGTFIVSWLLGLLKR